MVELLLPRVLIAIIGATVLTLFLGPRFIGWLRDNEVGQFVRPQGLIPEGHMEKKGTPTMGGLLILLSTTVPFVILSNRSTESMLVLFAALGCGAIGFFDDWTQIVRKRSLGISGRWRMAGLAVISIILAYAAVEIVGLRTTLEVPLVERSWDIGPLAYTLLIFIVVAGSANALNMTDGLDGLAAGTAAIALGTYVAIAFVTEQRDLAIFAATMVGACVGFLWFNSFPASVFMGDVGSYALGGAIAALAIMTKTEILLVVIGGVFVMETLSVMIQVVVFKRTKRRVFLMTPLHHHFEMADWSETKIIVRFWLLAALFGATGFTLFFRDFQP